MSVLNTTNENNCLTDSCFPKEFKTLFQSLMFSGYSDTFSLALASSYQFSYSFRCDNVKYVSKSRRNIF